MSSSSDLKCDIQPDKLVVQAAQARVFQVSDIFHGAMVKQAEAAVVRQGEAHPVC